MTAPRLRGNRRAFSAFYGAFAVLMAATLVVAAIAAQAPTHDGAASAPDRRTADRFLSTVLESTDPASGFAVGEALARLCLDGACDPALAPEAVLLRAAALAHNLSAPLGLKPLLSLSVGTLPELRSGSFDPRPGLPVARAEVFHPGVGGFVGLTVFLSA